jgi:Domain of unknown function (DUF3536)/Glycosyl hydrolase family 57
VSTPGPRHFVVHGHFYQPPREEPWLELVPREPSAAPDHDWNDRITRQCYAPLSRAPVLGADGRMEHVVNCYAWCSFDAGPTLLRWFDDHAPEVRDAMRDGDEASRARTGFGNALAMPYHHLILPLASPRDRLTEIRWGIRDFRNRFGRDPEGMWLPETAVDTPTLQALADEGITFTILASHQVTKPPPFGRPGLWRAPNGKTLVLFIYDGLFSHEIAFGDLLRDADRWRRDMLSISVPADGGPSITTIATDGETFGHHHHFGDLGLAAFIQRSAAELTNCADLLHRYPPQHDVTLVEDTSWSCAHGIERWRSDCGCHVQAGTSQAWRAPLRHGLDALSRQLAALADQHWPPGAPPIRQALDASGGDLSGAASLDTAARRWLEVERESLAMFSSCAWFFDDIAGLESRMALWHAARALELLPRGSSTPLAAELVATLAQAHSNDPASGTGADIWIRDVLPMTHGTAHLAAGLAALRDFSPDALDDLVLASHTWNLDGDAIVTMHRRTGIAHRWRVASTTYGLVPMTVEVRTIDADGADEGEPLCVGVREYPDPVRGLLRQVARPMVFDAALGADDRVALTGGVLDAATALAQAVRGAWTLIDRDGLDAADVVLHGVLDLFELDQLPFADGLRADAFRRLVALPPGPARNTLATRLDLDLPDQPS